MKFILRQIQCGSNEQVIINNYLGERYIVFYKKTGNNNDQFVKACKAFAIENNLKETIADDCYAVINYFKDGSGPFTEIIRNDFIAFIMNENGQTFEKINRY